MRLVDVHHVEHATGPQSPEFYAAVTFADDRVKEVWDEREAAFSGRATLVVTADHGFFAYRQSIQQNVLLRSVRKGC